MADVISTLFGITPRQAELQRRGDDLGLGGLFAAATLNPYADTSVQNAYLKQQQAQFALGSMGARGLGSLFGLQDPEVKKAADIESILSQTQEELGEDLSNPEVLFPALVNKLQAAGYGREATMAAMEGQKAIQDYKLSNAKILSEQASAQKSLQEKKLPIEQLIEARNTALAAGDLESAQIFQNKINMDTTKEVSADNLADKQILQDFVNKYGPTDGALAYDQYKAQQKEKISALQGTGQVTNQMGAEIGSYDDKGNFRTKDNRLIPKETIAEFSASNEASTRLLNIFQNINEADIDKAFGFIDTTQNAALRFTANPELVAAQYKINQAGVRDILNNLQDLKGASTDMEMRKMASTFPGFEAKPDVMKQWLARAKATTLDFLNRQKNSYGFDAPNVDLFAITADPLFKTLSEQERSNLIDRLAKWDVNFQALPEKEKIKVLAELAKADYNIDGVQGSFRNQQPTVSIGTRKKVIADGKEIEAVFDGKGWKKVK